MSASTFSSTISPPSTSPLSSLSGLIVRSLFSQNCNNDSLDRALGAAATIGLSVAVLRFVSYSLGGGQASESLSHPQQQHSLGRLIIVSLIRRIKSLRRYFTIRRLLGGGGEIMPREGDEYFFAAYGQRSGNYECDEEDSTLKIHLGSCHCASIQFTLRGPRKLKAFDSPGKIRYPHIPTVATEFQLTSGTKFLGVYYVTLPSSSDGQSSNSSDDVITAAHTFCKRCGVPILRAPDSNRNRVEVNANCLDLSVVEGDNNTPVVSFKEGDERSLAAGMPLSHQWNREITTATAERESHRQHELCSPGTFASPRNQVKSITSPRSSPVISMNPKSRLFSNSDFDEAPGTPEQSSFNYADNYMSDPPSTSATLSTASCTNTASYYSCHTSSAEPVVGSTSTSGQSPPQQVQKRSSRLFDQESSSIESNDIPSVNDCNSHLHLGIGQWAVGSSLRSLTDKKIPRQRTAAIDAPVLRDQLKYYMNKHLKDKPQSF
eukprot:CAMPEP_0172491658 /NCGR_PEP_ID=MMETSP1066-20121228/22534_1 /TAXON_ID=671091 /ORGANISM="Coscinodiscus wailesii, Strain CCMP2513" /LENGTH=489 /DNA_ID=CAMNT_0013260819 /DNA_START=169 /DNA_END=1638 /DNA_ORIENTATION=+